MSMKGVKARIIEEYNILKNDFSNYFEKVHNKKKDFDATKGYDQLEMDPKKPKKPYQSLLYSTYAQLRLLIDIKPDLKNQ